MEDPSPKHRFVIPTGDDLRQLRIEKGLSQSKLARLASTEGERFSQPLIARIENGTVNPPLSKVRRMLEVLYGEVAAREITARGLAVRAIITALDSEPIATAIAMMGAKGVSQLPVANSNGRLVGCVTEKKVAENIMAIGREALSLPVSSIMEAPLPEIRTDASIGEIQNQLLSGPALVVKDGEKVYGILTKTDLLRYFNESKK